MTDDKLTIGVIGTGSGVMRALGGDRPATIKDEITAPPVVTGTHGRAWLCDLDAARTNLGVDSGSDATLAHWIIEATWAHPIWNSYSLVLVHLRPMADHRPTMFYLDDATHEIWLYAIDPDKSRALLIAGAEVDGHWLQPKNFAAQFIEVTDDLARTRVRAAVHMICDAKLSPDTDFILSWANLFGDNMLKDRLSRRPPKVVT